MRYAIDNPYRVSALILVSPAGAPTAGQDLTALLRRFHMESSGDARAFVNDLYHQSPWYSSLIARYVRAQVRRPHIRGLVDSVAEDQHISSESLRKLEVPVLFVWGQSERLLLPEHRRWFLENLPPSAQVLEPAGFGHLPHIERPSELARLTWAFLRERATAGQLAGPAPLIAQG
jgi:pimeloyl-ACP methyl ester carboxylesterase